MIEGKTKTGFKFKIDEMVADDMELLDALIDADGGDPIKQMKGLNMILTKFLGEEQKKALYDHLRTEDGRIPVTKVSEATVEIMGATKKTKNS